MDGENNGKPYEHMDALGVFPYFWLNTLIIPPEHWRFRGIILSVQFALIFG